MPEGISLYGATGSKNIEGKVEGNFQPYVLGSIPVWEERKTGKARV